MFELKVLHLPLHDGLAQAPRRGEQHEVTEARLGVEGEYDTCGGNTEGVLGTCGMPRCLG